MSLTKRHARGFTLIELMMTLAVVAILLAVAAPAFGGLIQSTQAQSSRSALVTALNTARIFAVSKTANVVVCPSNDQRYCGHTILSTAGRVRVTYRPDGSSAGSNVSMTVCDQRGADQATSIVINNAGRVRNGVPTPAAAAACMGTFE